MPARIGDRALTKAEISVRHRARLKSGATPELRAAAIRDATKKHEWWEKKLSGETPEQRQLRLERKKRWYRGWIARETPGKYAHRLAEGRERAAVMLASETGEQRTERLKERRHRDRERWRADEIYRAKILLDGHVRRARKANAAGELTLDQWLAVYRFYEGRCVYCGRPANTMDHVLAMSRGGTHSVDNIVPACKSCNSSKRSQTPTEWYQAQVAA